jgi:4-hydroxythreonine-4-phosphate dehydrogenase
MSLPSIGITVGDPSGIGPEIAAKALVDPRVRAVCEPVLYGPPAGARFEPGVRSAEAARAAHEAIVRAVADAAAGRLAAIATGPISKEAFRMAGYPWPGHTELLAELCGVPRVAMMFHSDPLRVILLTVHIPLARVPSELTIDRVTGIVALSARELPAFGLPRPRLALTGLNPHAGENGLLGSEDRDVLEPSVRRSREAGIDIVGPLPADTAFVRAAAGEFDAVVACYHDQGLIPVKLLAFGRAVNVTLGLPIIRTSVDHGTAFDIAGRNVADEGSLVHAVLLAARLASARQPASRRDRHG